MLANRPLEKGSPNQEGMHSVLVGRYELMGNNVPQLPLGVLREY